MQETSVSVQKNVYLALRPLILVLGITKYASSSSSSSSSSSAPTLLAVLDRAVPGAEGVAGATAPCGGAGGGRGAPCPLTAGGRARSSTRFWFLWRVDLRNSANQTRSGTVRPQLAGGRVLFLWRCAEEIKYLSTVTGVQFTAPVGRSSSPRGELEG